MVPFQDLLLLHDLHRVDDARVFLADLEHLVGTQSGLKRLHCCASSDSRSEEQLQTYRFRVTRTCCSLLGLGSQMIPVASCARKR
jgi:hypothetical protein